MYAVFVGGSHILYRYDSSNLTFLDLFSIFASKLGYLYLFNSLEEAE